MKDALLLHDTLSITGILITGKLTSSSHFLATVSLRALLFLLGVGLGTFAILCFRRAKKEGGGFGNGVLVSMSSLSDIAFGLSIKRG